MTLADFQIGERTITIDHVKVVDYDAPGRKDYRLRFGIGLCNTLWLKNNHRGTIDWVEFPLNSAFVIQEQRL